MSYGRKKLTKKEEKERILDSYAIFMEVLSWQPRRVLDNLQEIIKVNDLDTVLDSSLCVKLKCEDYIGFTAKIINYKLGTTNGRKTKKTSK